MGIGVGNATANGVGNATAGGGVMGGRYDVGVTQFATKILHLEAKFKEKSMK